MALFKKSQPKKEEPKAEVVKEVKKETSAKKTGPAKTAKFDYFVIKKPWITEKATTESSKNKYAFLVKKDAVSPEVRKAVEAIYKVNVIGVSMVNTKSKTRRLGRSVGKKAGIKKAIVTVKEGQSIDIIPH